VKRVLLLILLFALPAAAHGATTTGTWPVFGANAARTNQGLDATGIIASNVGHLSHQRVSLDGTVDSSPVYWNGTLFVTTTYGRTEAIDARTGRVKWRFVPPAYSRVAGSAQITNASPL
jgi:outer membrane protein assembly factor BamB